MAPACFVYDDFEIELYRDYIKAGLGPFWYDQDPAGVLLLSRGCLGKCTFCNGRMIDNGQYRTYGVESTLMQLEYLQEKYQPKNFKIFDAMFEANKKQLKAVCDFMRKVKTPWGFETRPDTLKSKDIEMLKNSYCKYVLYGIESVNLETLKFNNKVSDKTTEEYYTKAAKIIREPWMQA